MFVFFFFSVGRMKKKKKERRKGGIDRRPRPSRAKITSRFESRSVRVRVALVILTHLRTTPVLLALFCPPLHLRVESSRGEARVGFEVALTAKKIFVNGIEGRSCFCFRPRFVLERNVSRLKVVPKFSFFFLRLVSSSSDSSNVLRMEKIHFRIYEK